MQYEISVEGLDASRTRRTPGKNKLQVGTGAVRHYTCAVLCMKVLFCSELGSLCMLLRGSELAALFGTPDRCMCN